MKKSLLLVAGLAMAMGASAAVEIGYVTPSNATVATAWGWDEESGAFDKNKSDHKAGTLLIETENVTAKTTFDDSSCASSCNASGVTYFVVNGEKFRKENNANDVFEGAVGNTNPAAITQLDPADPKPVLINKGWVIDYEPKTDGYLTVFGKVSFNKNLYVVEGVMNTAGDEVVPNGAVAYDFYGVNNGAADDICGTEPWIIKLPKDKDGYLDLKAADIENYVTGGAIGWPGKILHNLSTKTVDWDFAASSWPGVFSGTVFPVFAGCHYYYFCTGSKVTAGPYVFTKEYPTQFACVNETTPEGAETPVVTVYNLIGTYDPSAGIDAVAADAVAAELDWNKPVYNVMGQKVSNNYKGIAIQNGAKFIVK